MNRRLKVVEHPLEASLRDLDQAFADAKKAVSSSLRSSNLDVALAKKFDDPIEYAEHLSKAILDDIEQDHQDSMHAFARLDAAFDKVRDELIDFVTTRHTSGYC